MKFRPHAAAVFVAATVSSLASGADSAPPKGTLLWRHGDRLKGEWRGMTEAGLEFHTDLLRDPARIDLGSLSGWDAASAPRNQSGKSAAYPWTVTAGHSAVFPAAWSGMREQAIALTSTVTDSEITLDPDAPFELRRRSPASPVLHLGPHRAGDYGTEAPRMGSSSLPGQSWSMNTHGELSTHAIDLSATLVANLPEKVRIDLWLRSDSATPEFRFAARRGSMVMQLETWLSQPVAVAGDGLPVSLPPQPDHQFQVVIGIDFSSREATAFSMAGKKLAAWKLSSQGKDGAEKRSRSPGLVGALAGALMAGMNPTFSSPEPNRQSQTEGLTLVNTGPHLALQRLIVREWDGAPPPARPDNTPWLETVDGAVHKSPPESLEDGQLHLKDGTVLPLDQALVVRSPGAGKRAATAPSPDPLGADGDEDLSGIVWQGCDGVRFIGSPAGADAASMEARVPGFAKPLKLALREMASLRWRLPAADSAKEMDPAALDRWTWEDGKLAARGIWEPAPGRVPHWRLPGAAEASPMAGTRRWIIHRGSTGANAAREPARNAPALLVLRDSSVLPLHLQSADGKTIRGTSPVATDPAAVISINSSDARALELPHPQMSGLDFEDAGWMPLRGAPVTKPRDSTPPAQATPAKAGDTKTAPGKDSRQALLQLPAGSAMGHSSLLQGQALDLAFLPDEGYGTLRVRLFCAGLREAEPHVSMLFYRSSDTVYCGVEDPHNPGQISGNQVSIKGGSRNDPTRLSFGWQDGNLNARVNDRFAFKHSLNAKSRNGSGVILEPAGMWGNQVRPMAITEWNAHLPPGLRFRPALDEESQSWTLSVPRRRQDAPPTHLLVARNNDVLRGALESLDHRRVVLQSGLEKLDLPADRLALVLFPAGEDEEKPPKPPKEPGLFGVQCADGSRLNLKLEHLGPDWLEGEAPLLGRVRIPGRGVVLLRAGPLPVETAFKDWVMTRAPDPEIPEAGGAAGGPPAGAAAPEFETALLDGAQFDLKQQRGRVVVLDFWATWCGPCLQALPEVMKTVAEFPSDKVRLIGVNQGQAATDIETFLRARDWPLTVALDEDQEIGALFGVRGIPHTVVIDQEGRIAHASTGHSPDAAEKLRAILESLLAKP